MGAGGRSIDGFEEGRPDLVDNFINGIGDKETARYECFSFILLSTSSNVPLNGP